MQKLADIDLDGVAVISGIMSARYPDEAIKSYLQQKKIINNETRDHL
jgi:thiamine monophosphate synthase